MTIELRVVLPSTSPTDGDNLEAIVRSVLSLALGADVYVEQHHAHDPAQPRTRNWV